MEDRASYKIDKAAQLKQLEQRLSRRAFVKHIGQSAAGLTVLNAFGAGANAALQGLFGRNLVPIVWAAEAQLLA